MLPRLLEMLDRFPVVALVGPRQAGKTTLALAVADGLDAQVQYVDLELPSDCAKFEDTEMYLSSRQDRLMILDEIQRVPEVFQTMRASSIGADRQAAETAYTLSWARPRQSYFARRQNHWLEESPT